MQQFATETASQMPSQVTIRSDRKRRKPGPRPSKRTSRSLGNAGGLLKESILRTAIELFAERGFAGVRISDIASKAGAEAPTIYHYFGDKRSLYLEACRACFIQDSRATVQPWRPGQSAEAALFQHVLRTCNVLIKHRAFYMLIQRQLLELEGGEMRAFVAGSFEESFRNLLDILRQLQPRQDPTRMAVYIYSLIFGAARLTPLWESARWIHFPECREPEKLARLVTGLLFPGIDWTQISDCR
jgi:AcrR family transcriptional regulator